MSAVYGFVRENFDKKCWIDEVMAIIIQFYVIKGGSLYVCGKGQHGRLGIEKYKNKYCKTPALCPPFIDDNALKVSVGSNHTLVIDTQGDVWCFGRGDYGQLGNGKTDDLYVPTKLNLEKRVIAISAGREHSLFLCEDGTVKGCGSNEYGQIGLGDLEKTLVPKTIETLKEHKIIQISTGYIFSAALTEDGALFCFGGNCYGQCGVGMEKGNFIRIPTKVDFDDEIEFVDCGDIHTFVISCKGLTFSFGKGEYGRLGHGKEEVWSQEDKYVPTLIDSLKGQRMIRCAAGYEHSLCIDNEGIIWSFGWNGSGQLGLSEDITIQKTPKIISWFVKNNIKVKKCFAGDDQSSIIAHDGCLYLFGCNDDYQIGLNEDKYYHTPTKLSISQNIAVQRVSMGAYHSAIICERNGKS